MVASTKRWSDYITLVPLTGGGALAYSGLTNSTAALSAHERRAYEQRDISDLTADEIKTLQAGGLVVADAFCELDELERSYNNHRYSTSSMTLTVAPNMACNFACDYCFQGMDKPRGAMSAEVADNLLGLVKAGLGRAKALGLCWYGGEPLLSKEFIRKESWRYINAASKAGASYWASIVTNGFLLDEDTARMLAGVQVKQMQITLDGSEGDHDKRRILHSGKSTYAKIVDNIAMCVATVPIKISIRVNIDSRNKDNIRALIDDLAARGLGTKDGVSMYFAPVESITQECGDCASGCMSKASYSVLETELHQYAVEQGLAYPQYPGRFLGVCGAVKPLGFVVVPTGEVHKCWDTVNRPELSIGNVANLSALAENELHTNWMKWTPFNQQGCVDCKLLPACAGACSYKSVHGDYVVGEASLPCPSWKFDIKRRIAACAVAQKEISWDDVSRDGLDTLPTEMTIPSRRVVSEVCG